MTPTDKLKAAYRQLDFLSAMLLAWDTDRVEIDEELIDGLWQTIECIKEQVKPAEILH